jgi:flavin reductase (DIM6/NTAB) family NADH-FMN oxidoreductase RutF
VNPVTRQPIDESGNLQPQWLIPTGVFVVTLRSGDRTNAYAAGWVTRISESPVVVQVAVWEENYSYELAQDCPSFVVQILEEGQQDVAYHFGRKTGRDSDKLAGFATFPGQTGIPVLTDCLAFLECEVVFRWQAGDHLVLVGRVVHSELRGRGTPLIYDYRDYCRESPDEKARQDGTPSGDGDAAPRAVQE